MPSVTAKLISAGVIVEADLWRITTGVTAVNPAKYAAVKAYLDGINFGPLQLFLSRGLSASQVAISNDAARMVTAIHRSTQPPWQSIASQNAMRGSAVQVQDSGFGTATFLYRGVARFFEQFVIDETGKKVLWIDYVPARTVMTKTTFVSNFDSFAGVAPLGPLVKQTINSTTSGFKETNYNAPRYIVSSAEIPGGVVTVATPMATPTKTLWPLLEGPPLITYGEIINWTDVTFEYYALTMADLAEAVTAGQIKFGTNSSQTAEFLQSCQKQPLAGYVFCRAGAKPLNPFYLLDGARDLATSALDNAGVVDGVDYALVKQKWVPGAEVVAGFSPYTMSSIKDGSFVAKVITAIGETASAAFSVANDTLTLAANPQLTVSVVGSLGPIRQLLMAGKGVVIAAADPMDFRSVTSADALNAKIATMISSLPVAFSRDGVCAGLGPALITGLTQPLNSAQVKVVKGFLQPSYISLL